MDAILKELDVPENMQARYDKFKKIYLELCLEAVEEEAEMLALAGGRPTMLERYHGELRRLQEKKESYKMGMISLLLAIWREKQK